MTIQGATTPIQTPRRDWAGIGIGLAAAFALVALFVAGMWGLVIIVEAST